VVLKRAGSSHTSRPSRELAEGEERGLCEDVTHGKGVWTLSWATWLRVASVVISILAAFCWIKSSLVPTRLAPGGAIGGTLPSDPFNVALGNAAWWNQRAAFLTGVSVLLMAAAEALGLRLRTGWPSGWL
jgi:hypothetical protein